MTPSCHEPDTRIALSILDYLVKHPDAKDTLTGIASWWLLRDYVDKLLQQVSHAIDFLVAQDLIKTRDLQDHTRIFELNPERLQDIELIIKTRSFTIAGQNEKQIRTQKGPGR